MVAAALRLLRLIAILTAVSMTAVAISVALVAPVRAAAPSADGGKAPESDLVRRTMERRAVEAVIWGMPAVNYDLMYQAMLKAGGS